MSPATPLRLRKHHALGNDFLLYMDATGGRPLDAALARSLCDRHTGVGADGLIRLTSAPGGAVRMELRNADGSPAETSGNGLRCVAQAALLEALVTGPELDITTAAGPRRARVGPTADDGVAAVSVGMGHAVVGAEQADEDPRRRRRPVDMGNPHLVVLVPDPDVVDLAEEGAAEQARHPDGINVEYVAVSGPDRLRIRTWERGAGETQACGSGSCAAAAAAREWGLVGDTVEVANPGGVVRVTFGQADLDTDPDASADAPTVVLTGPVQFVAMVEVAVGP